MGSESQLAGVMKVEDPDNHFCIVTLQLQDDASVLPEADFVTARYRLAKSSARASKLLLVVAVDALEGAFLACALSSCPRL